MYYYFLQGENMFYSPHKTFVTIQGDKPYKELSSYILLKGNIIITAIIISLERE